jgi:hypothetical protein
METCARHETVYGCIHIYVLYGEVYEVRCFETEKIHFSKKLCLILELFSGRKLYDSRFTCEVRN